MKNTFKVFCVRDNGRGRTLAVYNTRKLANKHIREVSKVDTNKEYDLEVITLVVQNSVQPDVDKLTCDYSGAW
jgi:hypothetical protein